MICGMRASRLVSVLLLLQSRGRLTARQLAEQLDVSVRTIYRDIGSLQAAGVPVYGDAGLDGGYQLLDGYRTRLTGLTAGEAESLFLAGLPGPAAELGLGTVAAAARLKVLAALPDELRDRAGRIAARFHLDAPSWYAEGEQQPYLAAVAEAVWGDRILQVRYKRWRAPDEVTRTLRPYGLVLKAGRWYLVAATEPDRVATYRVSQILDLQSTGEGFKRPAGFDLAAYWRSYLDDFERRRHTSEAVLRVSPNGLERLTHHLGTGVTRAATASATPDRPRGWLRITIPIESVEHATGELLRLGAEVEVLAPAALRRRLASTAKRLALMYG
jgi:predicted DNA-binding transcriptional regulator YafY